MLRAPSVVTIIFVFGAGYCHADCPYGYRLLGSACVPIVQNQGGLKEQALPQTRYDAELYAPRPQAVAPSAPAGFSPPWTETDGGNSPVVSSGNKTTVIEVGSEKTLVPVRAYLHASEIPPASIGAYGLVVFRGKPTEATRNVLLMACRSFVAYLPKQDAIPSSVPLTDQMLTIWPVDDPTSPEVAQDNCDHVIDHYDIYGGDTAIRDAELQGAKFGERGPFLVGWSPSSSRGVPSKLVLVVDMSDFNTQDSFDHAFLFWKEKIVQNPSLWRSGFSLEVLRLSIRDFCDHYGKDILDAIKLSGKG